MNNTSKSPDDMLTKFKKGGLLEAMNDYFRKYFAQYHIDNPPRAVRKMFLSKIESILIKAALDFTGGRKSLTADILGMNRNTLRTRIKDLKII